MKKRKILAALTIGQAPRDDITRDILPLLPPDVDVREYGALDDWTEAEVAAQCSFLDGDEILISRMRGGRQVRFTARFIVPLVQAKIDQAEREGADATILFCTGVFPPFHHRKIFLEPEPIFHAVAEKLADGQKIGVIVPLPEQIPQARTFWKKSGVDITAVAASPYLEFEKIRRAGQSFNGQKLAFIVLDCMGFSAEMKHAVQEAGSLPVILPRTLAIRILNELFT